jgi:hypothetical protein
MVRTIRIDPRFEEQLHHIFVTAFDRRKEGCPPARILDVCAIRTLEYGLEQGNVPQGNGDVQRRLSVAVECPDISAITQEH